MQETFLFHTMLDELIPGVVWIDDHTAHHTKAWLTAHHTKAWLQAEGHMATMEWVWPIHDTGWSLDCLSDDCRPMVNRVLDTFNRHVANGRVKSVTCYMQPRKSPDALSDPGWLEWGVAMSDEAGKCVLYIAHIQRSIGADVERHT